MDLFLNQACREVRRGTRANLWGTDGFGEMSSRQSFSLGKALSAAVAGVPSAWGGAWLGLVLLWAATAAWPLAFAHLSCCIAAVGGVAVLWLLKLVALGGLYRTSIFGRNASAEGRGPGGLQFGATEVRLLFATLLIAAFIVVVVAAGLVVFAIAFDLSGLANGYNTSLAGWHAAFMRHHTPADWIFILLPVVMLVFFVFAGLKFSLAPVATVAEKRMVTLNAMGLSAGNVGKLFIGLVVLALPFIVLAVVAMHLMPHHGVMRPGMVHGAVVHAHLIQHAVAMALAVGLLLPLQTGFLTSAYRQIVDLRPK